MVRPILGDPMSGQQFAEQFAAAARKVGAEVETVATPAAAAAYVAARTGGELLLAGLAELRRGGLEQQLAAAGITVATGAARARAASAAAGLTGADFAIAATGTLVLESTDEDRRLASTLPEKHFVLLDPRKIVADSSAAVPLLRQLHARRPQTFVAYITGPSRTADIERVLTIGVHGPKELHILLCEGAADE